MNARKARGNGARAGRCAAIFGQSTGRGAAVSSPHSLIKPEICGIVFSRDKLSVGEV
jgi:hypothetical protein